MSDQHEDVIEIDEDGNVHALSPQAARDLAGLQPMRPDRDGWLFTDEFEQTWLLRRTGDRDCPLIIEIKTRA